MLVPQQVADETRGDLGLDLGHAEQRYLVRAGRRGMPSERAIRSDYRMSGPVIVRPISIRGISLVPSKMVKILAIGAVYPGQRPAAPRGISTDSARPVRDEFRFLGRPRARLACGAQTRFSRRTRAASKLEDALGGLLRNGYIAGTFLR